MGGSPMTARSGMTRRDFLWLGLAVAGCGGDRRRYDLAYAVHHDLQELDDVRGIIAEALDASLATIPAGLGDYALVLDAGLPKRKADMLAGKHTAILQAKGMLALDEHVAMVASGAFGRERRERPIPGRGDIPIRAGNLLAIERHVLESYLVPAVGGERKHDIPIFMAMISAESSFAAERIKPDGVGVGAYGSISPAGAVGYMQLMWFNVPEPRLDPEDLHLEKAGREEYARALAAFARGKSLEELAAEDVRFDPAANIYHGVMAMTKLLNGPFSPGQHTYQAYADGDRTLGKEARQGHGVTHTLLVRPRDAVIYSLAAYNWGAYATMGLIVDRRVHDREGFLQALRASVGSVAGYVDTVLERAAPYRIRTSPWLAATADSGRH